MHTLFSRPPTFPLPISTTNLRLSSPSTTSPPSPPRSPRSPRSHTLVPPQPHPNAQQNAAIPQNPSAHSSADIERLLALRQLLLRHQRASSDEERESDDDTLISSSASLEDVSRDETLVDWGCLGERARDSIDLNFERASTWESREGRSQKGRRRRARMVGRWLCGRLW